MADNFLPFQNPTTTDAKLDTTSLTVGANTVQRERIQIAGSTSTQLAPVDGTFGLTVNLVGVNGATTATGNGTTTAGCQRVNIASDQTAFSVNVANTPSVTGTVTANQGGTWTVQPGNTPNTAPWLITQSPATTGGLSTNKLICATSTNATVVKASAGQLYSFYITNINASPRYLKMYNKASAPSVGSDAVTQTFLIPGNATGTGATFSDTNGIAFSTGIAFGLTTGAADNDSGAVTAGDIIVNLFYK